MKKLGALVLLLACASCTCCPPKNSVELFNGKDLTGWTAFSSKPDVKCEDVWTVRSGTIVCKGEPIGWLATEKAYTNYQFTAEWRWAPGQKPGNSGFFQRINGEPAALPRCVECQLKSGDAGDLMGFQGMTVVGDPAHAMAPKKFALGELTGGARKTEMAEKAAGEWNRAEITVQGDRITVCVNGRKINEVTGVPVLAGRIGLQSEGGEVHFRNVRIVPMD